MTKEAVFTMKLESELRDAFMAAAEASHRPASQILRELMRDYVQREQQSLEYEAFLRAKVTKARESVANNKGRTQDEVSADFAIRRAQLLSRQ
jgi:predicted transcriptional regulator